MADNVTTQSATPATIPASTRIATREVTYSGDATTHVAPVGIVAFSGSDDAKTATDIPGDAANGLDVDVTRVSGTVTVDSELPAAAALADATANPTAPATADFLHGYNGSTWDRLRSTTANGLVVDVSRVQDVSAGPTNITTQNLNPNSGAATANSTVALSLNGASSVSIQVTGTYTGALTPQVTVDGSNWIALGSTSLLNVNAGTYSATIASATTGIFQADVAGFAQFRISALAAVTGTATVTIRASLGVGLIGIDSPLPAGTNVIGALSSNQTVNVAQINGVTTTMGNGASGTGVQRVTIASDSTGNIATIGTSVTPGTGAANLGKAEDAVAASGDTGVAVLAVRRDTPSSDVSGAGDYATLQVNSTGSLWVVPTTAVLDNAGFTDGTTPVAMAGFIFDETAGTALTENDAAAARIDSKRALVGVIEDATTRGQRAGVNTSGGLSVTPVPHTAGGLTISRTLSAASTNATSVKGSAGQVFGWYLYNANAAVRYLKLYNKATSPTVGTDTPVMTIPIPPGAGANVEFSHGIAFATGIGLALTTGVADADTAAVAANEIIVNLFYK
jgi:hypothetical protein